MILINLVDTKRHIYLFIGINKKMIIIQDGKNLPIHY